MLVISRKLKQGFVLEVEGREDIRITILDIQRGRVQLGVEAPTDVNIRRDELPKR